MDSEQTLPTHDFDACMRNLLDLLEQLLEWLDSDLRKRGMKMANDESDIMTDADWERVFSNPAVLDVLDNCPSNNSEYHDEDEDKRILENMRSRAPWLNRIMRDAVAEMEHGA